MDSIQDLTDYLGIDHHPDTWAEYASSYAKELVENFNKDEWERLKSIWNQQSNAWQIRLIDVIYSASSDDRFEILESMVLHADQPARDAAIEALELNTPGYLPPRDIVEMLRDLRQESADMFLNEDIDNLLRYAEYNDKAE